MAGFDQDVLVTFDWAKRKAVNDDNPGGNGNNNNGGNNNANNGNGNQQTRQMETAVPEIRTTVA